MLLRTFRLLRLLLNFKIMPGLIAQHYMVFLIFALNKYELDSAVYKAAAEYTHAYIKAAKAEFYFLKVWKGKVLSDRYYKEARLESFVDLDAAQKDAYRIFVNKIE